ncbi:SDR family NAD(P)-dependent oxidoreductase [Streptomyces sp. NPDC004009]
MLDLSDACALVAWRGRLMQSAPSGGAMVACEGTEEEVREALAGFGGCLDVAAVNGPSAVVVTGDEGAVLRWAQAWRGRGRRVSRLRVSHAFHSSHMDGVLERFREVAAAVVFHPPRIPLVSNVTGRVAAFEELRDPEYWVRQLRGTVRFHDGVRTLVDAGASVWLELGPDPVLTAMVRSSLTDDGTGAPVAAPLLRRGHEEARTLATALARAHVHGVHVDWRGFYPGARTVPLPTYAYQRERYWLSEPDGPVPAQSSGTHPLLDDGVELADGSGTLFTGRLDPRTRPWLTEHVIAGSPRLPGAGIADLALHAAGRITGDHQVTELTLEQPLPLTEAADLQLMAGAPGADGSRDLVLYARPVGTPAAPWTRHAGGTLAPTGTDESGPRDEAAPLGVWPPPDATPVPVDGLYDRLADRGYAYGPAYRGLRALWRGTADLYAEVTPPADPEGFALHPAALDAALHTLLGAAGDDSRLLVPFAWSGLVRHRPSGEGPLRVRLRREDADTYSLLIAADDGTPVLGVARLDLRELTGAEDRPADGAALFTVDWTERNPGAPLPGGPWAVLGPDGEEIRAAFRASGIRTTVHPGLDDLLRSLDEGAPVPALVVAPLPGAAEPHGGPTASGTSTAPGGADGHLGTAASRGSLASGGTARPGRPAGADTRPLHTALDLLGHWLADERLAASRLALVTSGAVQAASGDRADPARAAVWGLTRSAQSEHPGRLTLLDTDHHPASRGALATALASAESQVALRRGRTRVPLLRRHAGPPSGSRRTPFDEHSHVLITGGLGTLGRLLARHLVERHGVRRLLLTGRRGPHTPGAEEFAAALETLGAEVTIAACDAADRTALAAVLDGVPRDRPLTGVLHAAGVLEDQVVEALTPDRLDRVLAPKADAAVHLHALTRDLDLSAFVLFSSLAATLGTAGQGAYAAANAYLDALAAARHADGAPAVSLAWGLWAGEGEMTAGLGETDLRRLARSGVGTLTAGEGLALFDAALADGAPVLAPGRFDLSDLDPGTAPPVLRGLRPDIAAPTAAAAPARGLQDRLASAPHTERRHIILEAVRSEVAAVLGHVTQDRIPADRRFQDMGFDSLTALELRNRLSSVTGVRLPPTLVFDHPSPGALAERLGEDLTPRTEPREPAAGGDGSAVDVMSTDELVRLALGEARPEQL